MIAIIDYGMGNLRSVQKAFEQVGAEAVVTQDRAQIDRAEKVVLPGVGAIQPAMQRLAELNLLEVIRRTVKSGKPFLGICLGLQLLFENSDEGGRAKGMGVLPGRVVRFSQQKVPHMGWNQLDIDTKNPGILNGIEKGTFVYFCHSYYVQPGDEKFASARTDYGQTFVSAVAKGNVQGVQFHPEKSQTVGLKILRNFKDLRP